MDEEEIELYLFPSEPAETISLYKAVGHEGLEKKVFKMTNVLTKIRNELKSLDLKNWELTLKGYLEVSGGIPFVTSGKTGFEVTIKLSGQEQT